MAFETQMCPREIGSQAHPVLTRDSSREQKGSSMTTDREFAKFPHIALVYGPMLIGGIETLIVRVANFLAKRKYVVTLIAEDGPLLAALLPAIRKVIYRGTRHIRQVAQQGEIFDPTASDVLLLSFDPISAHRTLLIEKFIPATCKFRHISGVFHPSAYFMPGERWDRALLNKLLAFGLGTDALFFMNEACRDSHAAKWRTNLSHCAIIPLPIKWAPAKWANTRSPTLRIVSVGRLVQFKAYNLGAAKIAAACRAQGISLTWDIYGDGPQKDQIAKEIQRTSTQDIVFLKGTLPYEQLSATIQYYDLFVGMGTAALEAAALGIPTICATTDYADTCYGYIHNLPFGNVGETQCSTPTVAIGSLLKEYALSASDFRSEVSRLCRDAALRYDTESFCKTLLDLRTSTHLSFRRSMASALTYAATDSSLAHAARITIGSLRKFGFNASNLGRQLHTRTRLELSRIVSAWKQASK